MSPQTPPVGSPTTVATQQQLARIFPRCPADKLALYNPAINDMLVRAGTVTPTGAAAFLAQVGCETGGLLWFAEIWLVGRDPATLNPGQQAIQLAQARYQTMPRLGNSEPGDDFRFRGRGALQITGRGAYTRASAALPALGILGPDGQPMDLVAVPDLVAEVPASIFGTALWYWCAGTDAIVAAGGLTQFAEGGYFNAVSAGVNAGDPKSRAQYGVGERLMYYDLARAVLGA